jgi:NhaP-type Na+/H+ or K+/H+ antiporter
MLQRVFDHQRQPKELLKLPFGVVTIAAAAYVFLNGGTGQDTRDAVILIVVMTIILTVIDAAWWVTHRNS